jgi:prolyl-tRNA editing enzyme YbaK/EbsC (Cys-tRNA(Pro) deacylase)
MDRVEQALQELANSGLEFEVVACDPALADTAQFCAAYGYSVQDSANTLVVVGKSDPKVYAACVVLASTRLDVNGVVRKRLGTRKASFAPSEDTVRLTQMMPGGVTPFGLPVDLPIWIDSAVMEREQIICGGGGRDSKVLGPPTLLTALPNSEVVTDLAKPSAKE